MRRRRGAQRSNAVLIGLTYGALQLPVSGPALGGADLMPEPPASQPAPSGVNTDRIDRLNRAFLEHVERRGHEQAAAAQAVRENWEAYRHTTPQSFVPDALALLSAEYRAALNAFDTQRYVELRGLAADLRASPDPFLAANARYLYVRALIEQGLLEEAEAELAEPDSDLESHTPYAGHLRFIRAYCQASNLHFDEALQTLRGLQADFPDAPEPVSAGARQLTLEIERRERGTLDEVAALMNYSAARLNVSDATGRVQARQTEAVTLLDRLIEDAQQREQQQQSSGQRRALPEKRPRAAAQESTMPESGAAGPGEQHRAPVADPGEMWGRLPPAERAQILDSLRERFPSRYRQLVEQYYRSLAEEKQGSP